MDVVKKIHDLSQLVLIYFNVAIVSYIETLFISTSAHLPCLHAKGFSKTNRKKDKTRDPLFDKSEA